MPCYSPIKAYQIPELKTDSGKGRIVFSRRSSYRPGKEEYAIMLPCGKCVGCLLDRSRQWAVRCVHEASLWPQNCFITLTYRDECLPVNGTLEKRDFVLFMKRLRKRFGAKIRFFMCGEYGEKNRRPHYHACLFNFDFPDKEIWSIRDGVNLYRSASLEELWPDGFCTIGDVTFDSAAYVARYVLKKLDKAPMDADNFSGQVDEFVNMSRRPGIGRGWFEKYGRTDVYDSGDFVFTPGGGKVKPPRYYDRLFDLTDPLQFANIRADRISRAKDSPDNTSYRLAVREKSKTLQLERLKREL